MYEKGSYLTILQSTLIALLLMLNAGCKNVQQNRKADLAVFDISQESDWDFMAIANDGGYLLINEIAGKPREAFFRPTSQYTGYMITIDVNGRPEKAVINNYIFLFSNFTGSKLAVAIIFPDGSIEILRNIDTGIALKEHGLEDVEAINDWTTGLRVAGHAAGVAAKAIGIATAATGAGIAIAAVGCGATVLGLFAEVVPDNTQLLGLSANTIGTIPTVAGCVPPLSVSCVIGGVTSGIGLFTVAYDHITQNQQAVELARGFFQREPGNIPIAPVLSENIRWLQRGRDIDGEAAEDLSGSSVSIPDANTVAVGATGNDGNVGGAGHVRVFRFAGRRWMQKGGDINGEAFGDHSGWSVSMPDVNTVAVGARGNDGNGTDAGHVRVFSWDGSRWVQRGRGINGEAADDFSGTSVSMPDANTVAIGAPWNDANGTNAGHVRVFRWDGRRWVQRGGDIDGEAAGDHSGVSVYMPDANTVAVGATRNDGNGAYSGHVRIFRWDGRRWVQRGSDIDGEAADDRSGSSVSMPDANTVAIGATRNDGNGTDAGHVRVFRWDGSRWAQKGGDIDGEVAEDRSGSSVSMPDANTVAVGAIDNDGNGSWLRHVRVFSFRDAGHVRIFRWDGSRWVQKGGNIDGEWIYDGSGRSVSMPDANTVAVGATWNFGNGIESGHVRVYTVSTR